MLAYIKDPENPWLQVPDLGKTLMDFQLTSLSGAGGIGVGNLAFAGLRRLGASIWIAGPLAGVAGDGAVQAIDNAIHASTEGVYGRHGVDWIELGASAALGLAPGVGRAIGKWMDGGWRCVEHVQGRHARAERRVPESPMTLPMRRSPRRVERSRPSGISKWSRTAKAWSARSSVTCSPAITWRRRREIRRNVDGTSNRKLSIDEAEALRDSTTRR